MRQFITLFVITYHLVSLLSSGSKVYVAAINEIETKFGIALGNYGNFMPENIYIRLYQVEISRTQTHRPQKVVLYKFFLRESSSSERRLRIPRLANEAGFQTLVFITFSLDIEGQYVVDIIMAHFKAFNSAHSITGYYGVFQVVMGVYEEVKGWNRPERDLVVNMVVRLFNLNEGEVYGLRFLKYNRDYVIYFRPKKNQIYVDFPQYAEIKISLIDSRGQETSNPPPIKDIILVSTTNTPGQSQMSRVSIDTTEYMKKYDMKVEIYEPDTDRVWRSIYAFSGNAFIEKDSSKNQIDVIGLVPRMIEPGQDILPYQSLHFFERYTRVYQCVVDDKKAYFIEKIRKEFVVSSESLCLIDIYVENQKVAIIARACTQSEMDKCKSQPSQRTEL